MGYIIYSTISLFNTCFLGTFLNTKDIIVVLLLQDGVTDINLGCVEGFRVWGAYIVFGIGRGSLLVNHCINILFN